jgi:hypothetical protein
MWACEQLKMLERQQQYRRLGTFIGGRGRRAFGRETSENTVGNAKKYCTRRDAAIDLVRMMTVALGRRMHRSN